MHAKNYVPAVAVGALFGALAFAVFAHSPSQVSSEAWVQAAPTTRPAVSVISPGRASGIQFSSTQNAEYSVVENTVSGHDVNDVQPIAVSRSSPASLLYAATGSMVLISLALVASIFKRRTPADLPLLPTSGKRWAMMSTEGEGTVRTTSMQFIRGIDEMVVPDVRLTRSKDGMTGQAIFTFENPTAFDAANELGQITGLYMSDKEGTVSTTNVVAKFVNGVPSQIECVYVMRSSQEWDRYMRFMERYAEENGLGFKSS